MGWRAFVRSLGAAERRLEREADAASRRAQKEADRERHHLEDLRMKALGEQAKGKRGVWTREYETQAEAIQARDQAAAELRARQRRNGNIGCAAILFVFGVLWIRGRCTAAEDEQNHPIAVPIDTSATLSVTPPSPSPSSPKRAPPWKSRRADAGGF